MTDTRRAAPKVGVVLHTVGEPDSADPPGPLVDVPAAARAVEAAGLDAAWVPDVLTGDGRPGLEAMVTLGALAGATERIALGTSVLALPSRQLAWTATQVQTLQLLSGNRLVLGIGLGGFPGSAFWSTVGAPTRRRGAWLDAALVELSGLLAGETVRLGPEPGPGLTLRPEVPLPPLRLAGTSEAGLARAVGYGGWFGGGAGSGGPETLAPSIARLRELAAERGCPPPVVTVSPEVTIGIGPAARAEREARNRGLVAEGHLTEEQAALAPIVGTARDAADVLAAYVEVGVDEIVTSPSGHGRDWQRGLELLAETKALLA